MQTNSDSESLTVRIIFDDKQFADLVRRAQWKIRCWWPRMHLRRVKKRIQAVYWAKGHKHRLTRKELTARGLSRRKV